MMRRCRRLRHGGQQGALLGIQILLLANGRILYGIDDVVDIAVHLLLVQLQLITRRQLAAVEPGQMMGMRGRRRRWRLARQTGRRWRQKLARLYHWQQHARLLRRRLLVVQRGGALVVQPVRNYGYANRSRAGMTMMRELLLLLLWVVLVLWVVVLMVRVELMVRVVLMMQRCLRAASIIGIVQ